MAMAGDGDDIWEAYKRGVKAVAPSAPAIKPARGKIAVAALMPVPPPPPRAEGRPIASPTLERRREKAMRRGEIGIHAKLDLHGLTQAAAFAALASFLRKHVRAGARHLLIVTGKGAEGKGVLRANLKDWLGQLPEAGTVLALRQAAPAHGGAGAFYVILRARR